MVNDISALKYRNNNVRIFGIPTNAFLPEIMTHFEAGGDAPIIFVPRPCMVFDWLGAWDGFYAFE